MNCDTKTKRQDEEKSSWEEFKEANDFQKFAYFIIAVCLLLLAWGVVKDSSLMTEGSKETKLVLYYTDYNCSYCEKQMEDISEVSPNHSQIKYININTNSGWQKKEKANVSTVPTWVCTDDGERIVGYVDEENLKKLFNREGVNHPHYEGDRFEDYTKAQKEKFYEGLSDTVEVFNI